MASVDAQPATATRSLLDTESHHMQEFPEKTGPAFLESHHQLATSVIFKSVASIGLALKIPRDPGHPPQTMPQCKHTIRYHG